MCLLCVCDAMCRQVALLSTTRKTARKMVTNCDAKAEGVHWGRHGMSRFLQLCRVNY